MEMDLLGAQLLLALSFQESGFDPELELQDEIGSEKVRARELFSKSDGRWFMRAESIPGHLALKAIAVDESGLYLETSPVKAGEIRDLIVDRMLPFVARLEGETCLGFDDVTTSKELVTLGPATKPEIEGLGLRCLWTVSTAKIDSVRRHAAIQMIDAVFSVDAYHVEEMEVDAAGINSVGAAQRLAQTLQIGLQQKLRMEQRPVLSLSIGIKGDQIQAQTLELRQIMALNRRLLQMGPEELPRFFNDYIQRHGEKAALHVAIFAVAGKVKAARPGLSWKEARQVARKLMRAA